MRETVKKSGSIPLGVEGAADGQWVILDLGDIVFHAFYRPVREFYNIEGIWADARRGEVVPREDGSFDVRWARRPRAAAGRVENA